MNILQLDEQLLRKAANAIRLLAADGVQKANSGHPGMPMGMADVALVLWLEHLQYNPRDPQWPDRDRFVLSAGHGSMLLYSMLHLSGYDVTMEDLKSFRQWESRTPGHPEHGCLPGVETTTGPLGQGFATGVGMAIAAKMTAARVNRPGSEVFGTHTIFGIVSDGDLMEGVASEAASIAGHLRLDNIVYVYDSNKISIEGSTELTYSENVAQRFQAYGWQTLEIDAHNYREISAALAAGVREQHRPTLIIARSHIGYGSPAKHDTAECHGSPLGKDELRATKKNLGFAEDQDFVIPQDVSALFSERNKELAPVSMAWESRRIQWQKDHPDLAAEWKARQEGTVGIDIEKELLAVVPQNAQATRSLSGVLIQRIADLLPGFVGGSADLHPSTNTLMEKYSAIKAGDFSGKNFHFGIREHAMGSILNGIALYGGFIPFGATFFVFSDYMRPAIRLAALMGTQVIYVFTHDSIFLGEDGPTHQPIEHLAALRSIVNVDVLRPADGIETALAWCHALKRRNGPTALILTRQKVEPLMREKGLDGSQFSRGAYVVKQTQNGKPTVVLVATGSEVSVALSAQRILEKTMNVRVVSAPCRELLMRQPREVQEDIVPAGVPVVVIEAALGQGWGDLFRNDLLVLDIKRFGASAPLGVLAEKFGFTGNIVAEKVITWLKKTHA